LPSGCFALVSNIWPAIVAQIHCSLTNETQK
jgi:hypothetical protein